MLCVSIRDCGVDVLSLMVLCGGGGDGGLMVSVYALLFYVAVVMFAVAAIVSHGGAT